MASSSADVGTWTFTISLTDDGTPQDSKQFTITINAHPDLVGPVNGTQRGTIGVAFSDSFSASGGTGPYAYTVDSGSPPPGVALNSNGTLSGTPVVPGTFNFYAVATDSIGSASDPLLVTITVQPPGGIPASDAGPIGYGGD